MTSESDRKRARDSVKKAIESLTPEHLQKLKSAEADVTAAKGAVDDARAQAKAASLSALLADVFDEAKAGGFDIGPGGWIVAPNSARKAMVSVNPNGGLDVVSNGPGLTNVAQYDETTQQWGGQGQEKDALNALIAAIIKSLTT